MPDTPNEFEDALIIEKAYGTPFGEFVKSLHMQESSGGKNTKTSNRGAVGAMQVTKDAFKDVADKGWDFNDSFDTTRAGIRYAKKMWDMAGGDPRLAAVGYYGGPGGIEKAKRGVAVSDPVNPKAPNTFQYADQVVARMNGAGKSSGATVASQPTAATTTTTEPSPVADFPPVAITQADVSAFAPQGGKSHATGANPWMSFLAAMPQVPTAAIQPEDISFGNSPTLARLSLPPSTILGQSPRKPNFQAFSGWKGLS